MSEEPISEERPGAEPSASGGAEASPPGALRFPYQEFPWSRWRDVEPRIEAAIAELGGALNRRFGCELSSEFYAALFYYEVTGCFFEAMADRRLSAEEGAQARAPFAQLAAVRDRVLQRLQSSPRALEFDNFFVLRQQPVLASPHAV